MSDLNLPAANERRWVMRRKAQVVVAIRSGQLLFSEACKRYALSEYELRSWMTLLEQHGLRGLRSTRLQRYRPAAERPIARRIP